MNCFEVFIYIYILKTLFDILFFIQDNIYLYISRTGNGDVVDDIQFLRDDVRDFRVDHLNELIMKSYDWIEQVWEAEERVETSSIHEEQEEEEVDIDNKDVDDDFRTPMAS